MFKNSLIYKFLERSTWLQMIVLIFPIFLLGIYVYSYVTDLSNVVYMLNNNSTVAEKELKANALYEVVDYEGTADNYSALVKMDNNKQFTVNEETGTVFSVIFCNKDISSIVFEDGTIWKVPSDFLFDTVTDNQDGTYTLKYKDHEYKAEGENDFVYELSIIDLNKFKIAFTDDYTTEFEGHSNIQFRKDTKPYNIVVSANFEKQFNNLVINYTNNLPTENIYYSTQSGVFLKNLSKDFGTLFMKRSNLFIVMLAMMCYLVLLAVCRVKTDFSILGNPKAFILDALVITASLGLLLIMTLSVF